MTHFLHVYGLRVLFSGVWCVVLGYVVACIVLSRRVGVGPR